MSDTEELSKEYRRKIEHAIVGVRLTGIHWRNRPDFDNEILALHFEGGYVLHLYATDHGNIIWGEVEDA